MKKHLPTAYKTPSWGNTTALGVFAWLQPGREYQGEDVELANAMKDLLLDYAAEAVRGADRSPFHAPYGNVPKISFGDALPKGVLTKPLHWFAPICLRVRSRT